MTTMQGSSATRMSLVSRARAGHPAAWRELVELYGPLVASWCMKSRMDVHSAADCVQEVFASVSQALTSFRPTRQTGSFRAWLWTVTANKIRDAARTAKRAPIATGGSTALKDLQQVVARESLSDALIEEPTSNAELSQLTRRALEQVRGELETRTWEIFQRAVVDQIPTSLVAEQFGVTAAAVRQTRSRVLRRLRQQLGDLL